MEPVEPTYRSKDILVTKRRMAWLCDSLQEAHGSFRESRRPQIFSSYMALMSHIIDLDLSSYEEVEEHQVWRDSMMEEY